MRKLALDDEILLQIDKAARYIGGEVNSVMKDKEKVDIRFCMAFPDVTEWSRYNSVIMLYIVVNGYMLSDIYELKILIRYWIKWYDIVVSSNLL